MIGVSAAAVRKYKCVNFNGSNQYITFGNQTSYNFERTDSFSLSCWLKWSFTGTTMSIINKLTNTGPFRGYDIYLRFNGTIGFSLQSDGSPNTNAISVGTSQVAGDNRWHHVVATYGGTSLASGVHIYIDGYDAPLTTFTNGLTTTTQNAVTFAIGGRPDGGFILPYPGKAMDLAVYNKALSQAEVTTIHNSHVPPRLTAVGPTANLVGYWLMGVHRGDINLNSGIIAPTNVPDLGTGAHAGTMVSMSSSDVLTKT